VCVFKFISHTLNQSKTFGFRQAQKKCKACSTFVTLAKKQKNYYYPTIKQKLTHTSSYLTFIMLAVNTYSKDYIQSCLTHLETQLTHYKNLVTLAKRCVSTQPNIEDAIAHFDNSYYNSLVILIDSYFAQRAHNKEGKDANSLHEVRILVHSILYNEGKMETPIKEMKIDARNSVLGYKQGEHVEINEKGFIRLYKAFFADIKANYAE
jgi:hypothetical protein